MQYEMQVFQAEDQTQFRTVLIDGEPWFVLADVCRALDLKPSNGSFYHHASRLDPDERRVVGANDVRIGTSTSGVEVPRGATMIVINESGLYSMILSSNKPEAKRFKKWVTSEVLPTIRRTGTYGIGVPAFIRRYNENWDRVETGYFSVINELVVHLWGRLEHAGHVMADRAPDGTENRPDVSVGRCFADWLRKHHPSVETSFSYYIHWTPQADVEARQYPLSLLPLFREFLDTVWIPNYGPAYLKTRDPAALPYLQRLLPSPNKPRQGMMRRRSIFRR